MAKALRVDDVRKDPDGMFTIETTYGTPPLAAGLERVGVRFSDVQDVKDWLADMDERDNRDILLRFLLARFRAIDPDMDTPALIKGRIATFNADSNNMLIVS
jgi:hypothetical protein